MTGTSLPPYEPVHLIDRRPKDQRDLILYTPEGVELEVPPEWGYAISRLGDSLEAAMCTWGFSVTGRWVRDHLGPMWVTDIFPSDELLENVRRYCPLVRQDPRATIIRRWREPQEADDPLAQIRAEWRWMHIPKGVVGVEPVAEVEFQSHYLILRPESGSVFTLSGRRGTAEVNGVRYADFGSQHHNPYEGLSAAMGIIGSVLLPYRAVHEQEQPQQRGL